MTWPLESLVDMRRTLACLVLPALLFATPPLAARASDAPDSWNNPFCAASVAVIPWNDAAGAPAKQRLSRRFLMSLFADGRTSVAANVTLIADAGAYSVTVPTTALLREGGKDEFYAEPFLIGFDKPIDVRYAYVDRVGVDSTAPVDCPTFVSLVDPLDDVSTQGDAAGSASLTTLPAKFLQALPPLTCGRAYIPAKGKNLFTPVGHYGDYKRTTVVRVYIDSDGQPLKETLEQTSGVEGLDAAALGAVARATYTAAEFLCTPVVSEMTVDMDYEP